VLHQFQIKATMTHYFYFALKIFWKEREKTFFIKKVFSQKNQNFLAKTPKLSRKNPKTFSQKTKNSPMR